MRKNKNHQFFHLNPKSIFFFKGDVVEGEIYIKAETKLAQNFLDSIPLSSLIFLLLT